MLAHKLSTPKCRNLLYSNVLFFLETNGEQNTVDMSLEDLAEAGKIGFAYVVFLSVQETE